MAQNYTKMWDAFLGGEWAGGGEAVEGQYEEQTRDFYRNILDPAFDLPGFGDTDLAGAYAQFSNVEFEGAERTFRSEIGDPYGGGAGDPFSWEKVSRYNTEDSRGVDRLQDLLEDQLYGQGKFLGGQAGADYGTATSKEVEAYSTGMRGESEALTYEGLTSGASLASGTSGATIRSGASMGVAEDVLIETYKKAKTLGADYRAGSELIERDLSKDLDTALTTYLEAIDDEKSRWFDSVMLNVNTYKKLGMDLPAGEIYDTMTDADMELAFGAGGELSAGPKGEAGFYNEWSCGYGQTWQPGPGGEGGQCVDTEAYDTEVAAAKFSSDPACGIGELRNETTGVCEVRDDLGLELDEYGYLCPPNDLGLQQCGECGKTMATCDDGSKTCDPGTCLETDECGTYGGGGETEACWNGSMACPGACPEDTRVVDCEGVPDGGAIEDKCGVCGGDGPIELCWDETLVCDLSDCPDMEDWIEPGGDEKGFQHQCGSGASSCFKMYGRTAHYDYVNCRCIPHGQGKGDNDAGKSVRSR